MITFMPPAISAGEVITIAKELGVPGMVDGSFIDVKPRIQQLLDALFEKRRVICSMTSSTATQPVMMAIARGLPARVSGITFLPRPNATNEVVTLANALIGKMPFVDVNAHLMRVVDALYSRDRCMAIIGVGELSSDIFNGLFAGRQISIDG